MPINHSKLTITASATKPNTVEVFIPYSDNFDKLLKQASKGKGKGIKPEFLIQVLCRHLIALNGAKTTKTGVVDNW